MVKEAQQIIKNAREWLGKGVQYQMGADNPQKMDCSAFIWRCLGQRKYNGKIWRNTDWLCGPGASKEFVKLDAATDGCIVVYPSHLVVLPNGVKKRRAGHVAIVTDASKHTIIDCSSSCNGIKERKGDFFWSHPHVVFLMPV